MADAIDIFQSKVARRKASDLCKVYGVTKKAIQDIWRGRTWARETLHLDSSRVLPFKKVGRPLGRRDTQPRKKRVTIPANFLENIFKPDSESMSVPETLIYSPRTQTLACPISNRTPSIDEKLHEWCMQGCWVDAFSKHML